MPIARVAMLLRLTAPDSGKAYFESVPATVTILLACIIACVVGVSSACSTLKVLLSEYGALVLKEGTRGAEGSLECVLEAAIDPEHFRQVEDKFKEATHSTFLVAYLPPPPCSDRPCV